MTTQVSLARLREFGITPDRDLGQHFLIDSNVLDVAGRLIALDLADVVLEVGAGVGVLTDWLAERVSVVHAIEIDRRLEPALRATIGDRANVRLQIADALDVELAGLEPAPTAMVANLPYAVATPVVMTALPLVPRFCVMVQRELADRFFASPGTKAYGASSVLIQIACERRGLRKVSRTVFVPAAQRRLRAGGLLAPRAVPVRRRSGNGCLRVVHAAFGYRRKTLANALRLAGLPAPPADVAGMRAEQLHAAAVPLAGGASCGDRARAGQGQSGAAGRAAPGGRLPPRWRRCSRPSTCSMSSSWSRPRRPPWRASTTRW